MRALVRLGELVEGLFPTDVCFPELLPEVALSSWRLELTSAIQALVSGESPSLSILLASLITTFRAYFAAFLKRMLNI